MYWEIDYMEIIAATRKRDEWKKQHFSSFFVNNFIVIFDISSLPLPHTKKRTSWFDCYSMLSRCVAIFFAVAAAAFMQHTHFNETANLFKNRNHSAFLRVVVVIVHILVFAVAPNCCFSVPNICLVPPPSHKLYHHKISHNIRENQFFPLSLSASLFNAHEGDDDEFLPLCTLAFTLCTLEGGRWEIDRRKIWKMTLNRSEIATEFIANQS